MNDTPSNQVMVDRVDQITCAKCGQAIDLSPVKPLTSITCPGCGATTTAPGQIGQFMITSVMGAGAMGAVFAATDTVLGRRVAIKVMRRQEGEDEKQAQLNFLREARALAAVNHPNVVQVHTIGQHKGQTYIVMELVGGAQSLEAEVNAGRQLDEKRALEIGRDVAEGLAVASRMRLIHGDVKPGNILIASDGTAKVVDFGLVQRSGRSDTDQPVWGTPYYVAPERVQGEPPDAATDIYSLGATLWHLLVGRPPFSGSTVKDVIMARLKKPAPDLAEARPDLGRATVHIVMKMMARNPAKRYADYDTVIDRFNTALKKLEAGTVAPASRPEVHADRPPRRSHSVSSRTMSRRAKASGPRRKRTTLIVNVVSLIIAAGAVVWMLMPRGGGAGGPSGTGTAYTATFDGPSLPAGWTAFGEGRFNGQGQYLLAAPAAAGDYNGLGCPLPKWADGFVCDVRLNPIRGMDALRGRIELAFTDDGGDGLALAITHDQSQRPVLRCTVTVDGRPLKAAVADLPYAPESMQFRVQWSRRFGEWTVRYGQGAANPVTSHPIGRVTVPEPVRAPTWFRVQIIGGPGPRGLSTGVDAFSLQRP